MALRSASFKKDGLVFLIFPLAQAKVRQEPKRAKVILNIILKSNHAIMRGFSDISQYQNCCPQQGESPGFPWLIIFYISAFTLAYINALYLENTWIRRNTLQLKTNESNVMVYQASFHQHIVVNGRTCNLQG